MRRIGILGGMSWESTALYYRLLNEGVRDRLGGLHSADLILRSLDFADVEGHFDADDWDGLGATLAAEALALQDQGAELLLIATNTVHRVADQIERDLGIPLVHIADAVGRTAAESGRHTAGLLGTHFTMTQPFYAERLARHGVATLVPEAGQRDLVDAIIFDELVLGRFTEESRQYVCSVAADLAEQGADCIVLGCTELELLVTGDDIPVDVIPSTAVHVRAGLDLALEA
ncbi:MAG: aspartate/glutamate racemase family protein [Candidatus Nanopelagicales bacterium]